MSWINITDYCALEIAGSIEAKAHATNATANFIQRLGKNAEIKAQRLYGIRETPTVLYAITNRVAIEGKKIGAVTQVADKSYALSKIVWETQADKEPTLSGTARQVENDAETTNYFAVPEFEITPEWIAQIPAFKFADEAEATPAFELPTADENDEPTNVDCELQKTRTEIWGFIRTNDITGDALAHDVTAAQITIDIRIAQYGNQKPTIVPGANWLIAAPLKLINNANEMPAWECRICRALERTNAQ